MAKPLGSPKTGGRKVGTPNARTNAFLELLEDRGINLLGEILNKAESIPTREQVDVYLALLPYVFPKRKPIEVPFQFSEHLNLLETSQLECLHAEIEKKLGLVPRSERPLTRKEIDREVQRAIIELQKEF